ncbi:ABC transporter substrate-binding protein [Ramlibacter tataouinensis]|uniref:ABC transporter substrate-binding protein n=1 Tax=Ramlibacter tataouinensis TaxID=94132 RepID=UPI001D106CFB|nr:ABC transporter substrate-binding protein [Ramlibacter tataouinensis]
MKRRTFCAAAMAASLAPAARAAEAGISDREIVLGQIIALSGPLAALTPDIVQGSAAWFNSVNEKGGVHGRKIRVITLDDGYVPANTVKAAQQLIEEEQTFALLNLTGTGNVAAILPLLEKEGMPLLGPITGANALRSPTPPNVFHLRASYGDETEKIVQHLVTVGIQRISVAYLDNGLGKDGLAGVERAMQKRGLKVYSSASVQQDASDVDKAVAALHHTRPEVVIMITTGKATVDFIKKYNATRRGMRFYALSVMGTQSTLRALGPDGVGVIVTSVVPFPWSASSPLARDFRAAMLKSGYENISFAGFEAYLNARTMTEGLRRAGPNPTRARFVAALESMKQVNFGGFEVGFSKENHQGSRYVELTIIGPGERWTK